MRLFFLLLVLVLVAGPLRTAAETPQIKLVLLIVVDQLRGDMPQRFGARFGAGGFRHLLEQGSFYTNAYYQHSNTFTAVGHATLATGGHTAQHGLPGNEWYDRRTGKQVYCVEDARYLLLGEETRAGNGTSPHNLTSSTIGDELVLATNGRSRVFSASVKDRGAIIPGGRLGKAFWYSKNTGRFLTSSYYYEEMPPWVETWNRERGAAHYSGQTWTLRHPASTYQNVDDRAVERTEAMGFRRTFPHAPGTAADPLFYGRLRDTPFADQLLMEFARATIDHERLGQGPATDLLALSFSATDYIGHVFGPQSREAEDNLLRLDETLAALFAHIDQSIGLDHTLIVLSADHGIDEIPEYRRGLNFAAGRVDIPGALTRINATLRDRFACAGDLVAAFTNPSLYLNRELIDTCGLDATTVERAVANEFRQVPGIARALTRGFLESMSLSSDPIAARAQRAFHPRLSGEILLIQKPFWYLHSNPEKYSAMHGSPHNYDTHVPIFFAGPDIESQQLHRLVAPADIAITLSTILGIQPPSGSVGQPLIEVLK